MGANGRRDYSRNAAGLTVRLMEGPGTRKPDCSRVVAQRLSIPRLAGVERFKVEIRRRSLPRCTPTSVPTRRVSKWPCDRARVRPQSARAAICRRPGTTSSPNGALSSFPCGGFSSSFCTPCGASTVAAAALWLSKKFLGRRQTHTDQSLHALLSPLSARGATRALVSVSPAQPRLTLPRRTPGFRTPSTYCGVSSG